MCALTCQHHQQQHRHHHCHQHQLQHLLAPGLLHPAGCLQALLRLLPVFLLLLQQTFLLPVLLRLLVPGGLPAAVQG
jgi:hypothetical protein